MSVVAFLQRLMGTTDESLLVQKRFEQNLVSTQEQDEELDTLQRRFDVVMRGVAVTQRRIQATPTKLSGQFEVNTPIPPGALDDPGSRDR
jgi:hypothetical protein